MKKITQIIAAIMLVLAVTAGAYASAQKSLAKIVVYYLDDFNVCQEALAEEGCAPTGTPDCVEPLFDLEENPLFISKQIYETREGSACVTPYEREQ